jgi:tryptophan halogenase
MQSRIDKIVIVGGGTAGWMTAAALGRSLEHSGVEITLIESDDIGTVGVGEATIPPLTGFNAFIGLDERQLLQETSATYKLGIEFVDWTRIGHRYVHPFGEYGFDIASVPFQHWWQRGRHRWPDIASFSVETRAALAGRFSHKTGIGHPQLKDTAYAFHLDACRYAATLRGLAEGRGVSRIEGRVTEAHRDGEAGQLNAVRLDGGRQIAGDLFVDCSGFCSLLLGETLGVPFDDWSAQLPCDRAWAVPCAGGGGAEPHTRATARAAGWQWRIPLQHRIGNGHVFSSSHMTDDDALDILMDTIEGEPLAEPRLLRFKAGRRRSFWSHNCVGIGLAAGFLEPLESTSIHLIQVGILRLLGLFPTAGFAPVLAATYNREMHRKYDGIRDFLMLHYLATERDDSQFWRERRATRPSETLAHKIELYRSGGILIHDEEDLFRPSSWLAVFEGQGIGTGERLPLIDRIPQELVDRRLEELDRVIGLAVADMPTADRYICDLQTS